MYYPTLDQLLLDATVGAMNTDRGVMNTDVDDLLANTAETDPRARVELLVNALSETIAESLPLGRKLIKLTVDSPPADGAPKRGHRRVGWIEQAIAPLRAELGPSRFERLVSALALVVGWEAFIVLFDVRGLTVAQARQVSLTSALALVDAARAEAPAASAETEIGEVE